MSAGRPSGGHDPLSVAAETWQLRGKDVDVAYKSRLFRFAHDLAASSFGMRQDIYEYWHGGDPNRNRINLLRGFNQSDVIDRIKDVISRPLPHGEVS